MHLVVQHLPHAYALSSFDWCSINIITNIKPSIILFTWGHIWAPYKSHFHDFLFPHQCDS